MITPADIRWIMDVIGLPERTFEFKVIVRAHEPVIIQASYYAREMDRQYIQQRIVNKKFRLIEESDDT